MLGSGAIIVVDDSTPVLDVALKVAQFYRHESCGKCTPCREGTRWTVSMLERIDSGEATPMDLDIMASVQDHIIGNCLCVLGDAMAMPIALDHRQVPRRARGAHAVPPARRDGARLMPRPSPQTITFSIDGREVQAPENMMLADAAKLGDVEIPVFCYEPKLGQPVGACRMCLVEIEGIPKLQTACSTAVKDGMVVHTQSERTRVAQQAVVEFLLINHPLDCPVCDKGGECPLQDITFGWGGGHSRFIEPKRHFRKPLELSPLIAIDRERCILCYRCVRYSQEISEDYQLILLERGAHSFVGTFDGHPYVAPFSGNIIELCPVGALTSRPYRFRARPWEIEGAGTLCTLCPAQCNVNLTVRDERVMRVLARQHDEVDDGWLCDKGRFAYQAVHADERDHRADDPRRRRAARGQLGARAQRGRVRPAPRRRAHRRARRRRREQRGGPRCSGACCATRSARRTWTRARAAPSRSSTGARSSAPALAAKVSDLEFAHAVLVLDCEPRRRRADPRAADPQGRAPQPRRARRRDRPPERARRDRRRRRCASRPGRGADAGRRARRRRCAARTRAAAAPTPTRCARSRRRCATPASEVVVLYGERLLDGGGAGALLALADALGLAATDGAGLIGDPRRRQRPRPARGGRAAQRRPRPRRARRSRAASTPPAIAAGARERRARRRLPARRRPAARPSRPRRPGSARSSTRRP